MLLQGAYVEVADSAVHETTHLAEDVEAGSKKRGSRLSRKSLKCLGVNIRFFRRPPRNISHSITNSLENNLRLDSASSTVRLAGTSPRATSRSCSIYECALRKRGVEMCRCRCPKSARRATAVLLLSVTRHHHLSYSASGSILFTIVIDRDRSCCIVCDPCRFITTFLSHPSFTRKLSLLFKSALVSNR